MNNLKNFDDENIHIEDNIIFNYHKLIEELIEENQVVRIVPFDF